MSGQRPMIVRSPFQLRPRSPKRSTTTCYPSDSGGGSNSRYAETPTPKFSDEQPISPRLLAPLSVRGKNQTMGDALSPSYDTRRPPSRGESSVPLVAKQMHYVHDVGTLHRRSRSMHFSELHKKFGSTTRGLAVAEDEEYSDNLPAHHDRILGELSTQLVEHTAAAGPPSRSTLYRGDNDYSTNSDSTRR